MARSVIPFPVRNSHSAVRQHDALARHLHSQDSAVAHGRDTQRQALRIAEQVEHEIAQQASRMATGARNSRVSHRVLQMPLPVGAQKPVVRAMFDALADKFFSR